MMTRYDDTMRTIVDLPDDQLDALDVLCARERISRAEAVRRAVAGHLERQRSPVVRQAFGIWRDRPVDALELQAKLRDEWDR